jgi:hypothetical protein
VSVQVVKPTTFIHSTRDTNKVLHSLSGVAWFHAANIFLQEPLRIKRTVSQIRDPLRNP